MAAAEDSQGLVDGRSAVFWAGVYGLGILAIFVILLLLTASPGAPGELRGEAGRALHEAGPYLDALGGRVVDAFRALARMAGA